MPPKSTHSQSGQMMKTKTAKIKTSKFQNQYKILVDSVTKTCRATYLDLLFFITQNLFCIVFGVFKCYFLFIKLTHLFFPFFSFLQKLKIKHQKRENSYYLITLIYVFEFILPKRATKGVPCATQEKPAITRTEDL